MSTALAIFMGQLFDIFGRRSIIVMNFFALAILVGICPYMSPNLYWCAANRMGVAITTHFIFANPCIADYIRPESRGFGVGLICLSQFLGQTIGTVVIVQFTQAWETKLSFMFVEVITLFCAVLIFLTIREPNHTDNENGKI
jgi:MFS family permease